MRTFLLLFFFFSLTLVSCDKDSNDIPTEDFIEITVHGQTYRDVANVGPGFSGQGGCDNKSYLTTLLGQIDVPTLFLNVYIKHYGNDMDFKASKPSEYDITAIAGYDVSVLVTGCNLGLGISYSDKQQSAVETVLQPGSHHNVTAIKEIESTSVHTGYSVSGTFSCSFKNNQGQIIPLTGKYRTKIYALK